MRKVALSIAALLVLLVVSPAFSQPFADVPTDHWAFDAIAELAAKGIVEGYPDGTFKGDRAMTRYEMAMVVARLLARIEAIKIPPPAPAPKIPAPEVTRRDIQTLQRLINEFRAELAALGVRVTAVEEELAALRARVDNTFITGDETYVYQGSATAPPFVARNRVRLTFRGRVGSHVTTFLRARWNSRWPSGNVTDFDRVYIDYNAPFGVTFRLGRDYWSLGPQGLLLLGQGSREGLRAQATFGPVALTGLGYFSQNSNTSTTYAFRGQFAPMAGWTFGVNYRSERDILGGIGGAWNALGSYTGAGFSFDVSGTLIPGVTLLLDYATFTPTAGCPAAGATAGVTYGCTALFAQFGIGSPILPSPISGVNVWYKNYQAYFNTQQTNTWQADRLIWLGNTGQLVTGWGADITFGVTSATSILLGYETGRWNYTGATWGASAVAGFTDGQAYTAFMAQLLHQLGHNASIAFEYYTLNNATTSTNVERSYAVIVRHRW